MKLQRYEPEISKITSTTASARMVQSEGCIIKYVCRHRQKNGKE